MCPRRKKSLGQWSRMVNWWTGCSSDVLSSMDDYYYYYYFHISLPMAIIGALAVSSMLSPNGITMPKKLSATEKKNIFFHVCSNIFFSSPWQDNRVQEIYFINNNRDKIGKRNWIELNAKSKRFNGVKYQ